MKNSLLACVEQFRNGEDQTGLKTFLNSMEDLQIMLDSLLQTADMEKLLRALRMLSICMKNLDITGMTDVLEFSLYPAVTEWIAGEGGK